MANFGRPHTNNSQFLISSVDCPQLDGQHVVFGHVKKGLSIISEMECYATDDGHTTRPILIIDCGELKTGENWGYCDDDGTADKLPPFPADWEKFDNEFNLSEKLEILKVIKEAGNYFYKAGRYVKSARKYKKVTRYFNFFKDHTNDDEEKFALDSFQLINLTNLAATELKMKDYEDVRYSCNGAIKIDPNNSKAFYRRGIANLELKNYEMALGDLKMAHKLIPENRTILIQFERAKKHLMDYREIEKVKYRKLFL